jgi:hypothetical protein
MLVRRLAVGILVLATLTVGCAVPAAWVVRHTASPPVVDPADPEQCEAEARMVARGGATTWPPGLGVMLDLVFLGTLLAHSTRAAEVGLGVTGGLLLLGLVEAEGLVDPAAREQYYEGYRQCLERKGYGFGP